MHNSPRTQDEHKHGKTFSHTSDRGKNDTIKHHFYQGINKNISALP